MARLVAWQQSLAPGLVMLLASLPAAPAARQLSGRLRLLATSQSSRRLEGMLAPHVPRRRSERVKAVLSVLWLLEAFLVVILLLDLINGLSAPAVTDPVLSDADTPSLGLIFVAVVVMPALILAVRWKQRQALDEEARQAAEERWATQLRAGDLLHAYSILYLQPGAPLHIAQAAYAAAMKRCHPDVAGGDSATAIRLNWAIGMIRARTGPGDVP
jgi:hypothetical protein